MPFIGENKAPDFSNSPHMPENNPLSHPVPSSSKPSVNPLSRSLPSSHSEPSGALHNLLGDRSSINTREIRNLYLKPEFHSLVAKTSKIQPFDSAAIGEKAHELIEGMIELDANKDGRVSRVEINRYFDKLHPGKVDLEWTKSRRKKELKDGTVTRDEIIERNREIREHELKKELLDKE